MLFSTVAFAEDGPLELNLDKPNWSNFKSYMMERKNSDYINGLSYVISGSVATVGGIIGYETSQDPIAKAVFGLSQSIGIAAIGYGAYQWNIGSEHNSVYAALSRSKLSENQRNEFLENYFAHLKVTKKKTRLIQAVTHGLVAGLNGYYAAKEKNKDLKAAFGFIAGINVLAAISYSF